MWSCSPDSFFPWLYMDSPVASHTRSRLKKRKVTLLSGIGGRESDLLQKDTKTVQIRQNIKGKNIEKKKFKKRRAAEKEDKENSNMNVSAMDKSKEAQTKIHTEEKDEGSKVVVLKAEEIAKSEDPEEELVKLGKFLNSSNSNWIIQYEAVDSIRRLAIHHSDILGTNLPKIIPFLQQGVCSLRSTMSRNALFAVAEVYKHLGKKFAAALIADSENTINVVLSKSINDKRFIATAGIAAAEQISIRTASFKVLCYFLSHSTSKSAKILAQAAKCALLCLKHIDPKAEIKESRLDEVIKAVAKMESGRSVDAKKPAQEILKIIYKSTDEDTFRVAMNKVLAPVECDRIYRLVKQGKSKSNAIPRKESIRELMMKKRQEALKNAENKEKSNNGFVL